MSLSSSSSSATLFGSLRWSPRPLGKFGLKLSSLALVDVGGGTVAYVPFGFTYFSPYKINIGFDIGPARGKWQESSFGNTNPRTNYFYIYGNIKIGFRI